MIKSSEPSKEARNRLVGLVKVKPPETDQEWNEFLIVREDEGQDFLGEKWRSLRYCQQNHLSPLTVIVVNQKTGLPGEGLTDADLNADREAVFSYNWFNLYPPTSEELAGAYKAGMANAQEILSHS